MCFGSDYKNIENSYSISSHKEDQINFLNLLSVCRLFKLKKIYLRNRNRNEIQNLKEMQRYIIYFFKKLYKRIFLKFKFNKSKNICFQEISVIVNQKNTRFLNTIKFDIKNSVTLKDINKTNRNLNKIFTEFVKFCITNIHSFAKIYFRFYLRIKSENKYILFSFRKNKLKNLINNFQTSQYKFLSIWQYRKNLYNSSLIIKFLFKHLNSFFFFNIIMQILEVIYCTLLLNCSISNHIKKMKKISMFLIKKIYFFILRLFKLEKLLFYDNSKIKNITYLKHEEFEKDQISEKNYYIKKIFTLEKTLNKIHGKLNCPNNSVKDEIISRLYKKTNCPVIKTSPKEVILYKCGHLFSSKCVKNLIITRNRKCPLCGQIFSNEDIRQVFLF
nr:E3 ubiquitin-protein ligase BRE1 [Cryptomonas curvata]